MVVLAVRASSVETTVPGVGENVLGSAMSPLCFAEMVSGLGVSTSGFGALFFLSKSFMAF